MKSFDYFSRQFVDWFFRRRSHALAVMKIGGVLAVLGFTAGVAFQVAFPSAQGPVTVNVNNSGGVGSIVSYAVGTVGIALIIFGVVWAWRDYSQEQRRLEKRRVVVVEVRGLRDTSGTPLSAAVPVALEGRRDPLVINLRQIEDGVIHKPEAALAKLSTLPIELERRFSDADRTDITIVYGGLAPVPLTFLTGVLLDDEGAITTMDWDRHKNQWRSLDADDDGNRFDIVGVARVGAGSTRVALAVSVSYAVNVAGIATAIPAMPLVEMRLREGSPDAHWSETKQQALGKQFLETVIELGNRGAAEVHLFLAAPNSLVFSFGRLYDKRNLPRITVYQHQRDESVVFPWGIRMPVAGLGTGEVVRA